MILIFSKTSYLLEIRSLSVFIFYTKDINTGGHQSTPRTVKQTPPWRRSWTLAGKLKFLHVVNVTKTITYCTESVTDKWRKLTIADHQVSAICLILNNL
jgi:hypothetical protein